MNRPRKVTRVAMRRFLRNEGGVAAIEFAFVAPALFLVTFGIIEFGRYFWQQSEMNRAVEFTLREAAIERDLVASDIQTRIKNRLPLLDPADISVTSSYSASTATAPKLLTVNVTYTLSLLGPLSSLTIPIKTSGQVPIIDIPT